MVVDERGPSGIEFGTVDAGIDCADAGHTPLQRDGGRGNFAESRTHRPYPRRRGDYRPAKTGRRILRMLFHHAAPNSGVAQGSRIASVRASAPWSVIRRTDRLTAC